MRLYVEVQTLWGHLKERLRRQDGASAVEYGLLLAMIAAVIIFIVKAAGTKVSNAFSTVNSLWE